MRRIPATLVVIEDVGVLLRGPAGSGKSDTALTLLADGHALVSDDGVDLVVAGTTVIGRAPGPGYGFLHLRGIGLIDVAAHYGAGALRPSSPIQLIIDLIDETVPPALQGQWRTTALAGRPVPALSLAAHRPLRALIPAAVRQLSSDRRTDAAEQFSQQQARACG